MNEKVKTGWIRYEYWTKGSHSNDNYLFIGEDAGLMAESDVFECILDHEGNWARYAESFRAEWETNVIPPKSVVEQKLKEVTARIEALTSYSDMLKDFL